MNSKAPIIIINGEPQSIFFELFIKSQKKIRNMSRPIILICSYSLIKKHMKKFNYKFEINLIDENYSNIKKKQINLINVPYDKFSFSKKKILSSSNNYIKESFKKALKILRDKKSNCVLNGPISKKTFLRGKFRGITEYLAKETKSKDPVMLIYNKSLSVCPLTTHVPLSEVSKEIKKNKIINKIKKIDTFYKKTLKTKAKIAVTGLNPHCESFKFNNKEKNEIIPAIKYLKKKMRINVEGPYAADTIFLKSNIKKFNVIVGMYHDQVLGPMKTIFGFNAINITLGLPFIRVSPDHGPNIKMLGKNISDPTSLIESIIFLEKYGNKT